MADPTLKDLFGAPKKQPPAYRSFELRIAEHKTARVLQIDSKFTPSQVENQRDEVKKSLLEDFEKLVNTLLR